MVTTTTQIHFVLWLKKKDNYIALPLAIRQKNQALNFLRMSARVDAVASRVQTVSFITDEKLSKMT